MRRIQLWPVRAVGGAVKSFRMRSLLRSSWCKQCYQADCRRKCPSSAEPPNLGSLSHRYFRRLDAGPSSLCGSWTWKSSRADEHAFVSTYMLTFIASSTRLRRLHPISVLSTFIPAFHIFHGKKKSVQNLDFSLNALNPDTKSNASEMNVVSLLQCTCWRL